MKKAIVIFILVVVTSFVFTKTAKCEEIITLKNCSDVMSNYSVLTKFTQEGARKISAECGKLSSESKKGKTETSVQVQDGQAAIKIGFEKRCKCAEVWDPNQRKYICPCGYTTVFVIRF